MSSISHSGNPARSLRAKSPHDVGGLGACRSLRPLCLLALLAACAYRPAPAYEAGGGVARTPSPREETATRETTDSATSVFPSVVLTATESIGDAGGRLELLPVASPFDVAVTADGSQRYRTRLIVHGLPNPATLGDYSTYVAWVVSWYLEDSERLGVVANEAIEMEEVRWNKFRVLITAERSPDVREPSGPVVLRGISPSGRLLPAAYCNLSAMGLC